MAELLAGPSNLHDDSSDSLICTPEEISEKAKEVTLQLLPNKSKKKYDIQYDLFMKWCATKHVKRYSESVVLAYLSELSAKYKSSTLWSIHSMLKATLSVRQNVDIGSYVKVNAFLKKQSVGHIPKTSKTFTSTEVNTFLRDAPDDIYLMLKVTCCSNNWNQRSL
ncbi:hypothetical protein PPYR_08675 [Photinus pyralis]|uniref:Integrase SAM-like N-terminal domain-containing protein n=1 Tax=Photinus pyralis TaxID=7054 RepID=A0A5N4AK03_PHOPY|nr:hypothetical protein PPYR_08675 [Photinus pyralis]